MDINELLAKADGILSQTQKKAVKKKRKQRERTNSTQRVGKRWFSTDGKERIYDTDGSIKYYHRWLVEQELGRPLLREEKVLWRDGNQKNNILENLQVLVLVDLSTLVCKDCGQSFFK